MVSNLAQVGYEDEENVIDHSEDEESIAPVHYDISSHGADYDVEGLVKRLQREDIIIPFFQRNYVWNISEASKFIESLLLGLPVPGIFLMREPDTNKLLVIDGQQRLKTLQFFYEGYFNPQQDDKRRRVFSLSKVQKRLEGKTYRDLSESDQVKLNDSLIHATIIKQDAPQNDDTSIYYIFDRLNSTGRLLNPQEIRAAVDHGPFINLIGELNEYENWREIYGKRSARLKDQELILRFLAFYFNRQNYSVPMKNFLNSFSQSKRNSETPFLSECRKVFTQTIDTAWRSLGKEAFKPAKIINAAAFDSVGVGFAERLKQGEITDLNAVANSYRELLNDREYQNAIGAVTSSENSVTTRMSKAIDAFKDVE